MRVTATREGDNVIIDAGIVKLSLTVEEAIELQAALTKATIREMAKEIVKMMQALERESK